MKLDPQDRWFDMVANRMQARDLVLLIIGECGESDEFGRTSMQKVSYLTSVVVDVDLGHRAYYYGPFSSAVEADAEALVLGGLVEETVTPLGVNAHGFARNKYHYKITESGSLRLEKVFAAYPTESERARDFIGEIKKVIGSFDQATLSPAAKTFYIAREQNKPVTAEEVQTLAKDFGWTLPHRRIDHMVELLSKLRLVQTQQ